ncbi:MAG: hypothetical protein OXE53_18390 [Deltaproteobacteria bacterium]|nr:hypothetical protein [Deltaproteobacteria bacterium]
MRIPPDHVLDQSISARDIGQHIAPRTGHGRGGILSAIFADTDTLDQPICQPSCRIAVGRRWPGCQAHSTPRQPGKQARNGSDTNMIGVWDQDHGAIIRVGSYASDAVAARTAHTTNYTAVSV